MDEPLLPCSACQERATVLYLLGAEDGCIWIARCGKHPFTIDRPGILRVGVTTVVGGLR